MNKYDCPTTDTLIDYGDGALDSEHNELVMLHVRECEACQSELEVLQRSLDIAIEGWSAEQITIDCSNGLQTAGTLEQIDKSPAVVRRLTPTRVLIGIASLAAVIVTGWVWMQLKPNASDIPSHVSSPTHGAIVVTEATLDVEQLIAHESQAARLTQAARILDNNPDLSDFASRSRRYVTTSYRFEDSQTPESISVEESL